MNCIFLCVFNQQKYIEMLYLLLESAFIYGNLGDDTEILIYTSTQFMKIIKASHLFCDKIKFEINDTYTDIDKSCKARLDLFYMESVKRYNKILYLDTDVIIKDDIHKIFSVIEKDILYVVEEGRIDIDINRDYWGKSLFGNEINNYDDKTAFISGMLLFNNCDKMKYLFDKIKEDIKLRPHQFHDQPHFVYNAFKYNLYDNKILTRLAVNNNHNINSDKVLHHFPGGPGIYEHKIVFMNKFMNALKDATIDKVIEKTKEYINENLLPIIHKSGELLEGNIFMLHHTTEYTDIFTNKIKNISMLLLNKNIKNVMEIGFNSGFSALLMLLSNPNVKVTSIDLAEHKYTIPCYDKMKETFGDRIKIIIGDSTKVLTNINETYDLIHIDGGHLIEVAESDIINSYRLSRCGTIIIMDDYDFSWLHTLWDKYVKIYNLKNLDINIISSKYHDIKHTLR